MRDHAVPAEDLGRFTISVRSVLIDAIEHPDSAIGGIAERTGFPQSHVSSSVAALRDGGALVTSRDPADRRRTLVRAAPDIEWRAAARLADAPVDDAVAAAIDADDPRVVSEVVAMLEASIEGAEFETTTADRRPRAWLATIVRA